MKKTFALCLAAVLLLAVFAGCSNKNSYSAIQKRGKIVVGTSADYPPHEYIQDGEFVGLDMDLIREVGDRLGLEVEIQDMGFDTLVAAVKQGKIDCAVACMNADPERMEQVDFSDVYFRDIHALMTNPASSVTLASEYDLANFTVGVQSGTNHETWLLENLVEEGLMDDSQIFRYEKTDLGVLDLASGRIDVYFTELPIARSFAAMNSDVQVVWEFDANPIYGGSRIAVQKGQDEFLEALNQVIAEMEADGFLDQLLDTWLV